MAKVAGLTGIAATVGDRQSQNFICSSTRKINLHLVLQALRSHHLPPAYRQVHRRERKQLIRGVEGRFI